MHPLSIFPTLLNFQFFAPLILRVAIGLLRLLAGVERYKHHKALGVLNIVASILIIVGLYTQVAVLSAIILIIVDYKLEKKANALMIAILLSLLLTGPGALAFDLPL